MHSTVSFGKPDSSVRGSAILEIVQQGEYYNSEGVILSTCKLLLNLERICGNQSRSEVVKAVIELLS